MKTIACIRVLVALMFTTSSPILAQWVQTNGPYGGTVNCLSPFQGTNLFAGTDGGGVFLSTNNGTSWTAVNTGLTNTDVCPSPFQGTNLFAGTWGGGVFLSTNNGTSWTAVNTGLTNTYVWSLAVSGTNLFAGTGGGGVFLSTNNGTSWTAVNTGLTNTLFGPSPFRARISLPGLGRRRLSIDQQRHKLDCRQYGLDEY
jgi:hypothetical protein